MFDEETLSLHKDMIKSFICVDLRELLGTFNQPKSGLKATLVKRSIDLLQTNDQKVFDKVKSLYE